MENKVDNKVMENVQEIAILDFRNLPQYQGAKERQQALVENNPFVEVKDTASYNTAKLHRTNLRLGRYELQNGKKIITQKVNDFKKVVDEETSLLIAITLPFEEKQQTEVERFEALKQAEKAEKERQERERIATIKSNLIDFRSTQQRNIASANYNSIGSVIELISNHEMNCQEFQADFEQSKSELIDLANQKRKQLQDAEDFRLENERLAHERKKLEEERKKIEEEKLKERERINAERKAEEERLQAEREKQEAQLKEEREKQEAQRKIDEQKQQLIREKQEALLKEEREQLEAEKQKLAQEKAEKEAKEKAEQQAKEKAEREAKEAEELKQKQEAEANRQEELKPDKQKMLEALELMKLPPLTLESSEAISLYLRIAHTFEEDIHECKNFINNL